MNLCIKIEKVYVINHLTCIENNKKTDVIYIETIQYRGNI